MSKPRKRSKSSQDPTRDEPSSKPGSVPLSNGISESSFQNLRERIEGNLKESQTRHSQKHKKTGPSQRVSNEPSSTSVGARGTKRDHNGRAKQQSYEKGKKTVHDAASKTKEAPVDLKALVAELGGTEDDIDLINGAVSDSELEGLEPESKTNEQPERKKGKSLESGMANILKEISLVRDTYADSESDEEETKTVNRTKVPVDPEADNDEDDIIIVKSAASEVQNQSRKKSKLHCAPRPDWFNQTPTTIDLEQEAKFDIPKKSVDQLHSHGLKLLQAEHEAFKTTQVSSTQSFYNTVITSGTLSDRISALTLAVQESPLHNMRALENLLSLAKKRSRSQAIDVLRALKDLFAQGSLLPSDRKLYTFATQPALISGLGQVKSWQSGDALPKGVTEAHLIAWTFEDWLKDQYFEVLKVLETWSNDEIEFAKARATSYVYELLKEKPEQEANLLRLLVNKLGDPVKKVASQASYQIMQLLANHPAMKEVVISAIDTEFVFKPGQTTHARYYAVVTLNQTALSVNEENIAVRLLNTYFGLFKLLLKPGEEKGPAQPKSQSRHRRQRMQAASAPSTEQEDELREKLVSALLTGVNRAYPYAGVNHQHFNEHVDTLYQITHSANFNTSIQAMMLIQQLIANTSTSSDRFYRVLYESLLDPRLISSSKQQLYLNLLHRSLKADLSQKRVKAFAKRIVQILSLQEPSFICGAFFLIQDLRKTFPSLDTMLDQPEDIEDVEEKFYDIESEARTTAVNGSGVIEQPKETTYDASKRDPSYANADASCLWDVLPYIAHYHPSVAVSAEHIIDHKNLPGNPDLTLHTLIHFLDRFVYKNAKVSADTKMRGSSIMQPMANDDAKGVLVSSTSQVRDLPVNSAEFLAKKDKEVAAQDVFFHQYFKNLGRSAVKKIKKKTKTDDDASENEDEVWQAMLNNAPDLEGLGPDDEDDISDMDGFEEEMDSDNVEEDEGSETVGSAIDVANDGDVVSDDGEGVDIEAGIFDDSDELDEEEMASQVSRSEGESMSEFSGLSSDEDKSKSRAPSKKTVHKREERERKKKLRALPTFASAADWAQELENDEDEDVG